MPKISDLGEFALIERIARKPKSKNILVGIGDDAAAVKAPKGSVVLTTDAMVENDHFKLGWFSPEQVGAKAIESNGIQPRPYIRPAINEVQRLGV